MSEKKINWKDAYFRFHRGSLYDSWKTRVKVDSYDFLYKLIHEKWEVCKYKTKMKIKDYGYDSRINRDTYIVMLATQIVLLKTPPLSGDGYFVGFIDVEKKEES